MLFQIYIHKCPFNHSAHAKNQARVSIFKDLIHGYFSLGYILLCFVIMLRQIIDNGFHSNNESCRDNLFFMLTQANYFNRWNSNFLRLCRIKKDFF